MDTHHQTICRLFTLVLVCFILTPSSKLNAQMVVDTNYIDSLFNVGYQIELQSPDSAINIYEQAGTLADKMEDKLRLGQSHNYRGIVYSDMGDYEAALKHNEIAIKLFEEVGYQAGIAATKINSGNIELYLGNYKKAVNIYYDGIETYESLGDTLRLLTTFINVGTLFYNNNYMSEAKNYYRQALDLAFKTSDNTYLPDLYMNLANIWRDQDDPKKYKSHLDSAVFYAEMVDQIYAKMLAYNAMISYFSDIKKYDSALFYAARAKSNALKYGNPYNIAEVYNRCGETFLVINNTDSAEYYLQAAQDIAAENGYKQIHASVLRNLSNLNIQNHNYSKAYQNLADYVNITSELTKSDQQEALQELDRKYQLVKKENRLQEQELMLALNEREIRRKDTMVAVGAVLFMLALIIGALLLVNIQNRKKIARKEMQRLQSEKEKEVVKALLDGEEKERMRIARELHDGINGNLAALKLNLNPNEKHQTLSLLDQTMNDVRTISHNLMPDAVKKFGLKEALENYISSMNGMDVVNIHFQYLGEENNLDDERSVNVYRMVQELVKNSLKHAGANEILVQITTGIDNLQITVEDDGKGFDTGVLKNSASDKSGIGLSNIENRVSYLQGSLDIRSSTHEGTSVNIEIPIQKTNLV